VYYKNTQRKRKSI